MAIINPYTQRELESKGWTFQSEDIGGERQTFTFKNWLESGEYTAEEFENATGVSYSEIRNANFGDIIIMGETSNEDPNSETASYSVVGMSNLSGALHQILTVAPESDVADMRFIIYSFYEDVGKVNVVNNQIVVAADDVISSEMIQNGAVTTEKLDAELAGLMQTLKGLVTNGYVYDPSLKMSGVVAQPYPRVGIQLSSSSNWNYYYIFTVAANSTSASIAHSISIPTTTIQWATYNLLDSVITAAKLAVNAVTTEKIANGAVTSLKLEGESVTNSKIALGAVSNDNIRDSTIRRSKIAPDVIDQIEDEAAAKTGFGGIFGLNDILNLWGVRITDANVLFARTGTKFSDWESLVYANQSRWFIFYTPSEGLQAIRTGALYRNGEKATVELTNIVENNSITRYYVELELESIENDVIAVTFNKQITTLANADIEWTGKEGGYVFLYNVPPAPIVATSYNRGYVNMYQSADGIPTFEIVTIAANETRAITLKRFNLENKITSLCLKDAAVTTEKLSTDVQAKLNSVPTLYELSKELPTDTKTALTAEEFNTEFGMQAAAISGLKIGDTLKGGGYCYGVGAITTKDTNVYIKLSAIESDTEAITISLWYDITNDMVTVSVI